MTREQRGLFARSPRNRMALGVAGGLAEALGVEPVLVRLALAALTVASGIGVPLYVAAWSLSYEPPSPAAWEPSAPRWAWRPTVAIACIVFGSHPGPARRRPLVR